MHIACADGHLDTVKLLAERQAVLNLADRHGRTPFFIACWNGELEIARFLLSTLHEQGHQDINGATNEGRTPFSIAAGWGHTEVVNLLLAEPRLGVAVNALETKKKRTALHWAAYSGRPAVVDLLLEKGADATIPDLNGETALALCGQGWAKNKSGDREHIIMALIDRDRTTAANDANLMATSAIKGSTQVIEKLLDARAHPSQQDDHGWTPLQLARQYGHTDAANLLARRGAEVGLRPSCWVTKKEKIKVSEDGCELEFVGDSKHSTGPESLRPMLTIIHSRGRYNTCRSSHPGRHRAFLLRNRNQEACGRQVTAVSTSHPCSSSEQMLAENPFWTALSA